MRNVKVKRLVQLGLLTAISIVLVYLVRFPIFPAAAYLEYDMADVPILIGTFLFGPWWGLMLTFTVSLLQWLLVSPASGWVGFLMHFCATGTNVLFAGFIYHRNHTIRGAILGMLVGAAAQVLMMIPLNLIFTVHFNGAPREAVVAMLPTVIIPFNLIKVGLNGLLTFLLYKKVGKLLKFEKTAAEN
ncbi:MAG: ECF transporter S component [Clostridia bacterium]|nr:ECF transporter S component [Clostridia bacterium]